MSLNPLKLFNFTKSSLSHLPYKFPYLLSSSYSTTLTALFLTAVELINRVVNHEVAFEIRPKNQLFLRLNFCRQCPQFLIFVDQVEVEYWHLVLVY